MAKVRQLFNNVSIETAKRKRICHHNRAKHQVAAGERCIVVRDATNNASKNYCVACGTAILDRAQQDLNDLRRELLE
ncbi:MAG: hypothetical protein WKF72_07460 [Nocardioidaceae bacterium]